jgi:hypothetical protein
MRIMETAKREQKFNIEKGGREMGSIMPIFLKKEPDSYLRLSGQSIDWIRYFDRKI